MKVVKMSEKTPWALRFACYSCRSDLEAESGDVKKGGFGGYCETDIRLYVACPVCGAARILTYKEVSDRQLADTVQRAKEKVQ